MLLGKHLWGSELWTPLPKASISCDTEGKRPIEREDVGEAVGGLRRKEKVLSSHLERGQWEG